VESTFLFLLQLWPVFLDSASNQAVLPTEYQVSDLSNDGPTVVFLQVLFYCWMKGGAGWFVWSPSQCGFPTQSIDMQVWIWIWWIGYAKLAVGMCVPQNSQCWVPSRRASSVNSMPYLMRVLIIPMRRTMQISVTNTRKYIYAICHVAHAF